jgi:hypothetical protein
MKSTNRAAKIRCIKQKSTKFIAHFCPGKNNKLILYPGLLCSSCRAMGHTDTEYDSKEQAELAARSYMDNLMNIKCVGVEDEMVIFHRDDKHWMTLYTPSPLDARQFADWINTLVK